MKVLTHLKRIYPILLIPLGMQTTVECAPKLFRVGTLNVNSREYNMEQFVQLMEAYELDIIALQECGLSLAKKIYHQFGGTFSLVYVPAGFEGNALFTRFPIERSLEITAHVDEDVELRSAATACIKIPLDDNSSIDLPHANAYRLWVIVTHLCHIYENDRLAQVKSILEQVKESNVCTLKPILLTI